MYTENVSPCLRCTWMNAEPDYRCQRLKWGSRTWISRQTFKSARELFLLWLISLATRSRFDFPLLQLSCCQAYPAASWSNSFVLNSKFLLLWGYFDRRGIRLPSWTTSAAWSSLEGTSSDGRSLEPRRSLDLIITITLRPHLKSLNDSWTHKFLQGIFVCFVTEAFLISVVCQQ